MLKTTNTDPIAECIELYVLPRGSYQIIIKCPFCPTKHLHGISRDGIVELLESGRTTHRLKHCIKDEGNKGYNIHIPKEMIEEVLAKGKSKAKKIKK